MVTYDAMNMLFQFGIFLTAALTAVVAIIADGKRGIGPIRIGLQQ